MILDLEERIIFEKDGLIVVNKPPYLPSTGRSLDQEDCLQFSMIERHGSMVWAIHQLDADTSGVNLFVTEKKIVRIYKEALEKTHSEKYYLAIVHNKPSWDSIEEFGSIGMIDNSSLGIHPDGKSAHSKFTVLDSNDKYALIRAQIFSGRTHQIRIHLSHLGHPLVGEEWYIPEACQIHSRQALHCQTIFLKSKEQEFQAPIPQDFQELLAKLNLSLPQL